jgi:hypothetical protein
MENNYLKPFASRQKAVDSALWLTFKYRMVGRVFGVQWLRKTNQHQVIELENRKRHSLLKFPINYAHLHYLQISDVCMDKDPLPHWEELRGMLTVTDGEVLRYILSHKIPIEKFIRFELASRGYDQNEQWVGFEKAYEIWLK